MPVVRSRGGRIEAGRGYPRLKWSNLTKSTVIVNDIDEDYNTFEKLNRQESKQICSNGASNSKCTAVSSKNINDLVHRVKNIDISQYDVESDGSDSENSLIYSDFRLSPESGQVRMAFTVPLTRLTSSQNRQQRVLRSTLQIKHSVFEKTKESSCYCSPNEIEDEKWSSPYGRSSSDGRISVIKIKNKKSNNPKYIPSKQNKHSVIEVRNSTLHDKITKEPLPQIPYVSNPIQQTKVLLNDKHKNVNCTNESSFANPNFHVCHRNKYERKESPRHVSFWHEIRAGGKGCVSSQKKRLRDATFIVSPTSSLKDLKNCDREFYVKETFNPVSSNFPGTIEFLKLFPRGGGEAFDVSHTTKDKGPKVALPCGRLVPSTGSSNKTFLHNVGPSSVLTSSDEIHRFEVSHIASRSVPLTFTSASHNGLRCYPAIKCHPPPKRNLTSLCRPLNDCVSSSVVPHSFPPQKKQSLPNSHHFPKHHHFCHTPKRNPFPSSDLGLIIRNRHAIMDSNDDLVNCVDDRCKIRFLRSYPLLIKQRILSGHFMKTLVGQRSSSGVGSLSKRPSNQSIPKSIAHEPNNNPSHRGSPSSSQIGSPRPSPSPSVSSPINSQFKGKRTIKAAFREAGIKKTPLTRGKPSPTQTGASSSPGGLHGRVLHKTSSVSPAPAKQPNTNPSSSSLTRFGFKSNPPITSGESTDSVNSILSDAQTNSDSNSNIFDYSEENGNTGSSDYSHGSQRIRNTKDTSSINRAQSPCTISQASSGVTSSVLNGRLKAQTKQLPKPQIVTVKPVNIKKLSSPNISLKSRLNSPANKQENSPLRASPLVMPKDQASKIPQTTTKSSLHKSQRVSRDSESSSKSSTTGDSGIGSSSEGDKLRLAELRIKNSEEETLNLNGNGIIEDNIENKEGFDLDVSDAWLKEKHAFLQTSKKKPSTLDLNLKEDSFPYPNSNLKNTNTDKIHKESFKERRDTTITYGMARQKFAPYNRNRGIYQNNIGKPASTSGGSVIKSSSVNTKSNDGGMVRNRIAQLEKTPVVDKSTLATDKKTIPKRPIARPTSFEKSPILVNSTLENTVELSRSICRRLEYSEGKGSLLEIFKDNKTDTDSSESHHSTAQDLLIVDSFEVKKGSSSNNEEKKVDLLTVVPLNHLETIVSAPCKYISEIECNNVIESKSLKDILECEQPTKKNSEDCGQLTYIHSVNVNNPVQKILEECEQMANTISNELNQPENGIIICKNVTPDPHIPFRDNVAELQLPSNELPVKLASPDESETSFEVLESLNESIDLSQSSDSQDKNVENNDSISVLNTSTNDCLTKVIVELSNSVDSPRSAKHSQNSPTRIIPTKKSRQDSEVEKVLQLQEDSGPSESLANRINSDTFQNKSTAMNISGSSHTSSSKVNVEYSPDSNRMTDSCDRSTVSGKCTPTLSSTRGEMDQDFLIDDEICDQPGLTFADTLEDSFFGDEDLFGDDLSSASLTHLVSKSGPPRSRHESMGTTSSLGGDELMLDYDSEEPSKNSFGSSTRYSDGLHTTKARQRRRPEALEHNLSIPGPRYEDEVLSPVACEIFNEWTAMLAEVQDPSDISSHLCISHHSSGVNTSSPITTLSTSTNNVGINTHQPLSNSTDSTDIRGFTGNNISRPRAVSSGAEFCNADVKRGVNFKPPRQGVPSEHEGGVSLDRTTLHYICQDVTAMKTLLLRLRRVLQVADTINPFDTDLKTSLYLSLGTSNSPTEKEESPAGAVDIIQENVDLKRQVVLLQQRLDEKDRSIRILQQQLAQALHQAPLNNLDSSNKQISSQNSSPTQVLPNNGVGNERIPSLPKTITNAATQTERSSHRSSNFSLASMSRTASVEDGLGPTVSSENRSVRNLRCARSEEGESNCNVGKSFYPLEVMSSPSLVSISSSSTEGAFVS